MPEQIKKSPMMIQLYGQDLSDAVYSRCQELGGEFNELVQRVVYDVFWARSGLTLKEKSLITVLSLIVLNKEEQLQIHLTGYFHQGGNPQEILQILSYMKNSGYISSADKASAILNKVTGENSVISANAQEIISSLNFNENLKGFIDLAARIALGDNAKTEACMRTLLKNQALSREQIQNVMLHQIVYCGFPCTMNGFAVLKKISDES